MRVIVAIVLGGLSGLLIYFIAAMVLITPDTNANVVPVLVAVTVLGGWVLSAYLLGRGAKSVSKVFTRGALLGAAEWIAVAVAGVIMSGRAVARVSSAVGNSDAALAGATIGGGVAAMVTGGISVAMAVLCLIVFAIAHFTGREMADTTSTPTKKCPECAEMVQAEARKCKHCGAALVAPAAERGDAPAVLRAATDQAATAHPGPSKAGRPWQAKYWQP